MQQKCWLLPYRKENFKKLKDELFSYAISIGAAPSGEHGIGTQKQKYLSLALDKNSHELMKKIKLENMQGFWMSK